MSADISKVEVGQRVRLTLVGTITALEASAFRFQSDTPEHGLHRGRWFYKDAIESAEVLPEPEPEWVVGDIVKDANGRIYECYQPGTKAAYALWLFGGKPDSPHTTIDDELRRPLEVIRKVES